MARRTQESIAAPPMPPPGPHYSRRAQWIGAVAVAATVLAFAVGAPRLVDVVAPGVRAGDTITVGNSISVTVAEGWRLSDTSNELFTILENRGAQYVPLPATDGAATGTADETIERLIATLEADATTDWSIEPIAQFTTDEGYTARVMVARSDSDVQEAWVVTDGDAVTNHSLTTPLRDYDAVSDSFGQMVRSVVIEEVAE